MEGFVNNIEMNELENYLTVGRLVLIKNEYDNMWDYNIISNVYRDTILIEFFDKKILNINIKNNIIKIKISEIDHELIIDGKVIEIYEEQNTYCKVKLLEYKKYKDSRKTKRYYCFWGANLKLIHENIGICAKVNNISFEAIGIYTIYKFEIGDDVTIDIITANNKLIQFEAEIVWVKKEKEIYECGARIKINHPEQSFILKNVIQKLEEYEEHIIGNWKESKKNLSGSSISNTNVLIIEDVKLSREKIKSVFKKIGITKISEASNGNEIIEYINLFTPDVITIDTTIAGIDGADIADLLIKHDISSRIIVIARDIKHEEKEELHKLGIKYILKKPFNDDVLEKIVRKLLNIEGD